MNYEIRTSLSTVDLVHNSHTFSLSFMTIDYRIRMFATKDSLKMVLDLVLVFACFLNWHLDLILIISNRSSIL